MTPDQILNFHAQTERRFALLTGPGRELAAPHLYGFCEDDPSVIDQIRKALRVKQVGTARTQAANARYWVIRGERRMRGQSAMGSLKQLQDEWRDYEIACNRPSKPVGTTYGEEG